MALLNYIGAREDPIQAANMLAGGRPCSVLPRRRRRVPENICVPQELRGNTETHALWRHREINEFSTQNVQARTKPGAMQSQKSWFCGTARLIARHDGIAKLAPGLEQPR